MDLDIQKTFDKNILNAEQRMKKQKDVEFVEKGWLYKKGFEKEGEFQLITD